MITPALGPMARWSIDNGAARNAASSQKALSNAAMAPTAMNGNAAARSIRSGSCGNATDHQEHQTGDRDGPEGSLLISSVTISAIAMSVRRSADAIGSCAASRGVGPLARSSAQITGW